MNAQIKADQEKARKCLIRIIDAIKDLAFRGHKGEEGNFMQLMNTLKSKNPELIDWMEQKKAWLSWKIQNEIIDKMSSRI